MADTSHADEIRCSFCSKTKSQVQQMFRGALGANICVECVEFCHELIEAPDLTHTETVGPAPMDPGAAQNSEGSG